MDQTDKKFHINFWYVFAAVIAMLLIQDLYLESRKLSPIPYSQFEKLVDEDKVKEVWISQNQIQGTLKQAEPDGTKDFITTRVQPPELAENLTKHGVIYSGVIESHWIADLLSWILPAIFFVGIWMFAIRRMGQGGLGGLMTIGKSRAKVYVEKETKVSFADVAGVDEAKEELVEIVNFLKDPKSYGRLGGRPPKGVLLVGPPGTGKTLLARAVAGEAGVPFFSISGSDFVEMFVGVGAARVRDLFAQAVEHAPSIIFIDELDALGKARGMNLLASHDEREQTLNQLLSEMDGFDPNQGVIIMAATNRPEILDAALLRPGRFDRQVLVDRPDVKGREKILRLHAKKIKLSSTVNLAQIAAKTPGFVGAYLANIVNEAALLAARQGKEAVETSDFDEAIERVIAGLQKKNRMMNPREKKTVAYHEAGHALVAELVPGADPVNKISIIPRGVAALGYTQQLPTEDRYLMTRSELMARIFVLLGGRVAEEMIFQDVSTGAQNDLQKATEIARNMATQFGMSERLGLVALEGSRTPVFLTVPTQGQKEYSEDTARLIDEEIKKVLSEAHNVVRNYLSMHRQALEELAKLLLEKEVVERPALQAILSRTDDGQHGDGKITASPDELQLASDHKP